MSKDCGICGIYPKWLRNRATPRNFIVVYGLLGTVQAMAFIYIVVTLTTLEKRFKIPSRTTGESLTPVITYNKISRRGEFILQILTKIHIIYRVRIYAALRSELCVAINYSFGAAWRLNVCLEKKIQMQNKLFILDIALYLDTTELSTSSCLNRLQPRIPLPAKPSSRASAGILAFKYLHTYESRFRVRLSSR